MTITNERNNEQLTIAIEGRLDTTTAPQLEQFLGENTDGIKDVIIDLVKAVCYLEGIELSENEIQVEFDYSRFENQEKVQMRLEREVSKGITSKVEYRMKVYGETEEIAKQKIDEIKKNEPSVKDLLGTNNEE